METHVSSANKEVVINAELPTVLIGERINPTGKKRMSEALQKGDLEIVRKEALAQVQAGADILDINVAAAGVDEVTLLPRAVQLVMKAVDVPLCLDSANPEAMEAALKVYKGKPLINSVTGEDGSMARVLPLVKEHGAAVIGLVQDEMGIPNESSRRLEIAYRIIQSAEAMGIPPTDVVIDCLSLSVGADNRAALVTFETIRRIKAELGVNLTVAASNTSFGLPDRDIINSAFVVTAIAMGVTCLILDVAKLRPVVSAADLILGRDDYARRYISAYRERQGQPTE
jgi:5-methyltetrahydrofolate--homocysteine methyltransferase